MIELLGWASRSLVFLRYTREFQETRKIFQNQLSRQTSLVYQETQIRQALILVQNLLQSPDKLEAHLQRFSASVIMEIAYGHHVTSEDDPFLRIADKINELTAGVGPQGSNIVDFFPILKKLPAWFPGAWFVRYAKESYPIYCRMRRYGFDEVRKEMARGTAKPSFLSLNLEDLARGGTENEGTENEDKLERLEASAFHLYETGTETTSSAVHTLVLALLLHPQAQRKAQEEVDKVIGSGRLPDFGDRESLPFVECLMYEALRWHSPAPLGIPHQLMEDDVYRGMSIPKGSTVIANIRSMTLDEKTYREPNTFFPERFLPQPAGFGEPRPDCVFGFGRRACPGQHLAEASIWIVLATLLAVFDIRPIQDEYGNDVIPPEEFHNSLTSHPAPFKCSIRLRSDLAKRLLA
ncbi:hypothetical protein NLI96_g12978 [Meripilus lineatus]|uniref:Cytochrome P450 n=1 Tax=Meripilus lineatus TaxID=2056292 RepID=A0AAD5UNT6_9APHY|nr:hypothetical protein NLI96_g12978 [Physisporinus lineatus]